MDSPHQVATISALEAATDALMVALGRRPDPDMQAAAAALKAREVALRALLQMDAKSRPPDISARIRRVLDRDREAADHLRQDMEALRERLASTRQMVNNYRSSARSTGQAATPTQVRTAPKIGVNPAGAMSSPSSSWRDL
jgi:hypothetical protein